MDVVGSALSPLTTLYGRAGQHCVSCLHVMLPGHACLPPSSVGPDPRLIEHKHPSCCHSLSPLSHNVTTPCLHKAEAHGQMGHQQ